jgi:hypothetical protein
MTSKKVETNAEGAPTGNVVFYFDDHVVAKPASPDGKEAAVTGVDSFVVFELSKVPGAETLDATSMAGRLAIHGASQKIGDSYAGVAKETDPLAAAKAAVAETIKQIYDGVWRVNAGGGPRVNDLAIAIARVTGQSLEGEDGAVAYVAAMSDEDKKVMRKKPKIAAELAKIALEKAQKRADELAKKAAEEDEPKAA